MITLYDLSAQEPIKTWSLNVWKVRYILNVKKLPYKTIYLEFPSIAPTLQQLNILPITKRDGSISYTVPSIVDDTTGTSISDSFKIAEYLDAQYPETPKAFPSGSIALQAAFDIQFVQKAYYLIPLVVPRTPAILNPISAEYYQRKVRLQNLSVLVGEELELLWKKAEGVFDWLEGLYEESGGPFFMGETPSYADFVVGGVLEEMRILGDGDRIKALNGGRWERLLSDLGKYASTEN